MYCNELHVPLDLALGLGKDDIFDHVMALQGEVFREMPGRRTVRFELPGNTLPAKSYFAKLHFGVGWAEIIKNLLTLRLPIVSAMTEVNAIRKFNEAGIPTTPLVAYGTRGCSPASMKSFVITQDLGDIVSLETLCSDWVANPPDARFKRRLIVQVAKIARILHENGMNHRDFYICHFCLDNKRLAEDEIYLYLIDLHRVGIRSAISQTARMKDLAGLYFSAMDIGLSKRDYLRFLSVYLDGLRNTEPDFWHRVEERAIRLYYKFHHKMPTLISW